MIFDLAIAVTWFAAAYRVWVLVKQPTTVWRAAVSAAMLATALAFTLYRFRLPIDQLSGSPNLSGLLARVIFAIGIGFLVVYLDALRELDRRSPLIRRRLIPAVAVSVVMTTSWLTAPVHQRPVVDLLPFAVHTSVVVYCLAFWIYLMWGLAVMSWTCVGRARQFRREDPTRSVSLAMVGVSAAGAIPTLILWSISVLMTRVTGADTTLINSIGDAILPWALLINALGALSLLALPYLSDLVGTWQRSRRLQPLWDELIRRYPQVHLDFRGTGGLLTRLQLRTERAIIEIHDALRLALVDVESGPSLQAIADGLHHPSGAGVRASDLLQRVDTREADIRQLDDLARAFSQGHR